MIFKNAKSLIELKVAFASIEKLGESYPNFYDWYWNKVTPGVICGNDQIIMAYKKDELVGISIIKDSDEKKLRALRIVDKFQKRGYGLYLIDESLKRLNTDKPVCSVNEDLINDYSRIFVNSYKFNLSHVYRGIYQKGKLEYEFNGLSNLKEKNELLRNNMFKNDKDFADLNKRIKRVRRYNSLQKSKNPFIRFFPTGKESLKYLVYNGGTSFSHVPIFKVIINTILKKTSILGERTIHYY